MEGSEGATVAAAAAGSRGGVGKSCEAAAGSCAGWRAAPSGCCGSGRCALCRVLQRARRGGRIGVGSGGDEGGGCSPGVCVCVCVCVVAGGRGGRRGQSRATSSAEPRAGGERRGPASAWRARTRGRAASGDSSRGAGGRKGALRPASSRLAGRRVTPRGRAAGTLGSERARRSLPRCFWTQPRSWVTNPPRRPLPARRGAALVTREEGD